MPRNACMFIDPQDMPIEMQLDLLVDAELPEAQRRELLAALDRAPGKWRELSLRFLERQVEKRSVRDLINRGSIFHADSLDIPPLYRFPGLSWMTPRNLRFVAAAVLVATASALLTIMLAQRGHTIAPAPAAEDAISANLPGSTLGLNSPVTVRVPLVADRIEQHSLFPSGGDGSSPRRSVVIQPDGSGNAVVIPVNTLPMKVY